MKKKFWDLMWNIDCWNHDHLEDFVLLWSLIGGWFCNWVSNNHPDMNSIEYMDDLLDYMDEDN